MKLSVNLENQVSLSSEHKFAYSVLKRLSIIEAIAAYQFQSPTSHLMSCPFGSLINTASQENHYSEEQKQAITTIFEQIDILSHLIANACSHEWANKPSTQVKKIGMESAKHVLPKFQNNMIEAPIKTFLQTQSAKLLERLNNPELITDLNIIKNTLTTCFPNIGQIELNIAISTMNKSIQQLQQLHNAEKEWIQVEQTSLGNNKSTLYGTPAAPAIPTTPEQPSKCVIC